jgi:spore protease
LADELSETGKRLAKKHEVSGLSVLVVGLGNARMTADALGPKTASALNVTRHLSTLEPSLYRALSCASMAAISPGVLGQTGIETLEILRGAVRTVKPDLLIAVDALAAGEVGRLGATVQISDTGIVPGSGVGNHRNALTKDTLGVPVIAIGVPTVVNSSTLVRDALEQAGIHTLCDPLQRVLENGRGFFVSSKDGDTVIETFSAILSRAIELAFVGDFSV